MALLYLTTADNPFNPQTDYKRWHDFDMQKGYYTAEYLDRVYEKNMDLKGKNPFSVDIDDAVMEESIDEIIDLNEKVLSRLPKKEGTSKIEYVKYVGSNK